MADLAIHQVVLIGLIFVWSGFVRTILGFGGAVLSLPFLLMVLDEPLVFLPIVAVHLLIFSCWIAWRGHRQLVAENGGRTPREGHFDWRYLFRAMKVMIIPKLIGVVGLLTLPGNILTNIIFVIAMVYAIGYVLDKPFRSHSRMVDTVLLPCAMVGHLLGERAHQHLLASRTNLYFRVLGAVLIVVSVVGLIGTTG